jgi:hypothetical protein
MQVGLGVDFPDSCAATLTVLDLPNLFALLERVDRAGDAGATIDLATSLVSRWSLY